MSDYMPHAYGFRYNDGHWDYGFFGVNEEEVREEVFQRFQEPWQSRRENWERIEREIGRVVPVMLTEVQEMTEAKEETAKA